MQQSLWRERVPDTNPAFAFGEMREAAERDDLDGLRAAFSRYVVLDHPRGWSLRELIVPYYVGQWQRLVALYQEQGRQWRGYVT